MRSGPAMPEPGTPGSATVASRLAGGEREGGQGPPLAKDEDALARLRALLDGEDRDLNDRVLDDLQRDVRALPEREMRRRVLAERMMELAAEELAALLVLLEGRATSGSGRARELLAEVALEPNVLSCLPYDRVAAAYALAREVGAEAAARMFLSARGDSNPTFGPANKDNAHLDLPLGLRRQAARTGDRFALDRLLHDRDVRVVRLLLDHPRLLERDVVRIAAMRPTRPEVLQEIARHRRWSSRYRVRVALACNPDTSAPIVLRLLPTLLRQDVRRGVQAGAFTGGVLEAAKRLLEN